MKTSDFDYFLPPELIAQTPIEPRDHSRLMVLRRHGISLEHRHFSDITDYVRDGDVLVFNDTRVIPARLVAHKDTGARLEVLLLQRTGPGVWETLVRPSKRAPVGTRMVVEKSKTGGAIPAEVIGEREGGIRVLGFSDESQLPHLGEIPLPPYIHEPLAEPERYQTIYSRAEGSVAAPTAGLHFTAQLMEKLRSKGVRTVFVTLHVGLDTFRPVRTENPLEHPIHREYGVVNPEAASEISSAKTEGRRVICVGTTSMRLVEAAARARGASFMEPYTGWVDLFIVPGHDFKAADAMITNFHLPRTTLLMLVSAFAGREFILNAYREAVARQYRFYSFGDAMLIL